MIFYLPNQVCNYTADEYKHKNTSIWLKWIHKSYGRRKEALSIRFIVSNFHHTYLKFGSCADWSTMSFPPLKKTSSQPEGDIPHLREKNILYADIYTPDRWITYCTFKENAKNIIFKREYNGVFIMLKLVNIQHGSFEKYYGT